MTRTDQSPGAPFLELMSTPDDTSVDDLVRLTGEDLAHHPVDVPGADEAEAMIDPEIAVEAAGLLVAGD